MKKLGPAVTKEIVRKWLESVPEEHAGRMTETLIGWAESTDNPDQALAAFAHAAGIEGDGEAAVNLGLVMFFVPPHVVLEPGSHETEECYVILRGKGTMTLAGKKVDVNAGTFIHLPPWCEHGIENTGDDTLEILICTSPPNP